MWLYVSGGFLSMVAHRNDECTLLVRARHPGHIASLFPDAAITHMPTADYPFRVNLPREVVKEVVANYLSQMRYDNFKSSIDDNDYHDVCLNVWHTMWVYGERHRNGGV